MIINYQDNVIYYKNNIKKVLNNMIMQSENIKNKYYHINQRIYLTL